MNESSRIFENSIFYLFLFLVTVCIVKVESFSSVKVPIEDDLTGYFFINVCNISNEVITERKIGKVI